jgi:hypothetical protein
VSCGRGRPWPPRSDEHGLGHARRARRDIDDSAVSHRVDHLAGGQLGECQGGGHIEGECAGHEPFAGVHRRPGHGAAGVVDQDVDPAELLNGGGNKTVTGTGVGDVCGHHQGPSTEASDVISHFLEIGPGASGHDHIGSRLRQADCDPPADSEPGAGDDCHPPLNPEPVEDHAAPCRIDRMLMRQPPLLPREPTPRGILWCVGPHPGHPSLVPQNCRVKVSQTAADAQR